MNSLKVNIKRIAIMLVLCIFSVHALKSQILIRGIVTDCKGQPLVGAYIQLKKDKNSEAVSDINGYYKIMVPDTNTVIKYSLIGYLSKEIKVGKRDSINVSLQEESSLLLSKPIIVKKPVIYLYPTATTELSVKLNYSGKLLFTYPHYDKKWEVIAHPDGKLINKKDNREYSYLFWDGEKNYSDRDVVYENGFVVPKDSIVQFLQNKLSQLGLKPHEYNEFIVFWTPYLAQNEWNFIHFRTKKDYNVISTNEVNPVPETEIRIFMDFKKVNAPFDIEPQKITTPTRKGFTLVEWGGAELKQTISVRQTNGKYENK